MRIIIAIFFLRCLCAYFKAVSHSFFFTLFLLCILHRFVFEYSIAVSCLASLFFFLLHFGVFKTCLCLSLSVLFSPRFPVLNKRKKKAEPTKKNNQQAQAWRIVFLNLCVTPVYSTDVVIGRKVILLSFFFLCPSFLSPVCEGEEL